jgi:hypothetical protein
MDRASRRAEMRAIIGDLKHPLFNVYLNLDINE